MVRFQIYEAQQSLLRWIEAPARLRPGLMGGWMTLLSFGAVEGRVAAVDGCAPRRAGHKEVVVCLLGYRSPFKGGAKR